MSGGSSTHFSIFVSSLNTVFLSSVSLVASVSVSLLSSVLPVVPFFAMASFPVVSSVLVVPSVSFEHSVSVMWSVSVVKAVSVMLYLSVVSSVSVNISSPYGYLLIEDKCKVSSCSSKIRSNCLSMGIIGLYRGGWSSLLSRCSILRCAHSR